MAEPGETSETFKEWLSSKAGAGAYEEHLKVCNITSVEGLKAATSKKLIECYIPKDIADKIIAAAKPPLPNALRRINLTPFKLSQGGSRHKKSRRHKRKSTRKRSKTSKRTH